jgi:hypothetical protein
MGAPCELDIWSGRPLSGNANFCPGALVAADATDGGSNEWGMQLDTAMHEITHALGFSSRLFSRFVDDDGATPLDPPAVAALSDWAVRAPRLRSSFAHRSSLIAPPLRAERYCIVRRVTAGTCRGGCALWRCRDAWGGAGKQRRSWHAVEPLGAAVAAG